MEKMEKMENMEKMESLHLRNMQMNGAGSRRNHEKY